MADIASGVFAVVGLVVGAGVEYARERWARDDRRVEREHAEAGARRQAQHTALLELQDSLHDFAVAAVNVASQPAGSGPARETALTEGHLQATRLRAIRNRIDDAGIREAVDSLLAAMNAVADASRKRRDESEMASLLDDLSSRSDQALDAIGPILRLNQ